MAKLITTLGAKGENELGMILPHEHVFTDLRTPDKPGYGEGKVEDVVTLMAPEIRKAQAVGVTALVECTPEGVGRRADALKAVSEATGFPLVVPTGIYREPWVPAWAYSASEEELYRWMRSELEEQIGKTGVQAGFIKLSAGDNGLTETETKILHAAARAAAATGATIASHTVKASVVTCQLGVLELCNCPLEHFVWVHATAEPDVKPNIELGKRGIWVEFDWIGGGVADDIYIRRIQAMLDAGLGHRLLISHDRGWYDPGKPQGGTPRPYTHISEVFIPKLKAAGLSEAAITELVVKNPFKAFAR